MPPRTDPTIRYWAKVDQSGGPESCWPWMACRNYKGYGLFWDGKLRVATRWGWEHLNGPIGEGLQLCHTCDTPSCMNPAHWFLGTALDNQRDKVSKGRQATGDRNGSRSRPDRRATGERNGAATHPEMVIRGDAHYARNRPELLPRGQGHGMAKLNDVAVRSIRSRHAAGTPTHVLAAEHGIAHSTVRKIVARKSWQHI